MIRKSRKLQKMVKKDGYGASGKISRKPEMSPVNRNPIVNLFSVIQITWTD